MVRLAAPRMPMMPARLLLLGLLPLTLGAADGTLPLSARERAELRARSPLRLCVDPDYPPFEFVERGRHRGIAADYMGAIASMLGVEMRVVPAESWEEALAHARAGECDVLPLLNQTPARSEYLDFTRPYIVSAVAIVSRERQYYDGLQALNGRTVALPGGYRFTEVISTKYPGIRILPVSSLNEALRAVSEGSADATLDNQQRLLGEVMRMGLDNLSYAGDAGLVDEFRIGVRQGDATLLTLLNRAAANIPPDRVREIMQRWYVVPVKPERDWTWVLLVSAVAAAVVCTLLFHFGRRGRLYQLLEQKNRQLEQLSETDALTLLANRRRIDARLRDEIDRARRYRRPFSVLLFDIDEFKEINDTHGHLVGDQVLVELAGLVRRLLRSSDVAGRWGGEEFVVLCPEASRVYAEGLAERLRRGVEGHVFAGGVRTTISLGVCELTAEDSASTLLTRVDHALYRAKAVGRNRVAADGDLAGLAAVD